MGGDGRRWSSCKIRFLPMMSNVFLENFKNRTSLMTGGGGYSKLEVKKAEKREVVMEIS